MAKTFSGKQVVKILCKQFLVFCSITKRKPFKLQKSGLDGKITTIVPLHKELARGTFRGILELAEVNEEEFLKFK